ncbi:hypothetical protein [Caballeronia sp. TF1N1]|uniref:hypothetical protein n=1 Tax=Caballeronia sp. TF1N1 TaxID=2878153 RepID=UPI00272E43C7|nr:hypothetical protein [Caballeronia sp. TF1N1]
MAAIKVVGTIMVLIAAMAIMAAGTKEGITTVPARSSVPLDLKVRKAHRVIKVRLVRKERRATRAIPARKVFKVCKGPKVTPDCKVRQVLWAPTEQMV